MAHHRSVSLALLLLGLVATAVALVTGYVRSELLSSDAFGDRATQAVRSAPVQEAVATAFADEAIARQPRLLSARPVIISAAESVLASRAAGGVVSGSAAQLHRAVVVGDQPSLVLDLADLSVLVRAYLTTTGGELPEQLRSPPGPLTAPIVAPELRPGTLRAARSARVLALVSPAVALLCFAAALWFAPDRRGAVLRLGSGLMLLTAGLAAAFVVVREAVVPGTGASAAAGELHAAVFDAFLGDFLRWLSVVGVAGAVMASAAVTMLGPVHASALPTALWKAVRREPANPWRRAARNLALVVGGGLVIASPQAAVTLAASLGGAYLAVLGLVGLLNLFVGTGAPSDEVASVAADARRAGRTPVWGRHETSPHGAAPIARRFPVAVAGIALAVPFAAAAVVGSAADTGAVAAALHGDPQACNGSRALCDRRLDQVVFPSTHNANANAAAGFLNANQALGLGAQLDLGVRGMQLDALAGQRNAQGVVRTDLTGESEDTVVAQIGEEGLAAAQRLAGRIAFGPIEGDTDLYLCHVLCELGATRAVDEFRVIRSWLDRNPREVLILFIQDEAGRELIVDALTESGLGEVARPLRLGQPFPTLRQMLSSGQRVAIFAERQAGPAPWYLPGFQFFQETPFANRSLDDLTADDTCRPNRGTPTAPLFQLNHWVESYPPNPVRADTANAPSFILRRARRCMRERQRVPNVLAVDFVERGDLIGAARTLNAELAAGQTG